ncbi:MAG: extracellular solute-binding protein [Lachnospiraceae bacterium]|nr:extracellular solute-binding protein [Lachnospiraceae bacterium]
MNKISRRDFLRGTAAGAVMMAMGMTIPTVAFAEEETYDLGGVTLTVLNQSNIADLNPNAEGLEEYQVAERQEKLDAIQEKYNVVLEFVDLPTGDWDDEAAEIVSAYASGNPVADIMDAYYQFAGTYIANGILYDFSEDFASNDVFNESYYFTWMSKQWGLSTGIGGEGLYYNKTWVQELGMQYTPAEMFDMGLWSYDDCYNYMLEMKSYLAEDEYPLFVSPYYWMLFATAANGEIILDTSGNLNYCSDAFLESLEFFAKCLSDGLIAPAPQTESGYDTWSYPGSTFDAGNTLVMAHRAAWQASYISAGFELGFVPYPWGTNVTIESTGNSGDYLTLSDNYAATYYDGQLLCLTEGIQDKADPMIVMQMVAEWMGWDGAFVGYEAEENDNTSCGWLEDGLDKDLYFYSLSIERLEPFNSLDLDLNLAPNATMYGGGSIRSAMESYYNQDMALMIDAGYASEDVYTPYDVEE